MIHKTSGPFHPTPPDSTYLWHLISDWELKLETILRGGLWFARLDQFDDALEGTLPPQNWGLLKKTFPSQHKLVEDEYDRLVLRSFALCFHMSDDDPTSAAWSSFGGNRTGVAIKTTYTNLQTALCPISGDDGPVYIGQVRYIDYPIDSIPDTNTIEAAFSIQNNYSEEREARALIHTYGGCAIGKLSGTCGLFGPLVKHPEKPNSTTGKHELVASHNCGKAIVPKIDAAAFIEEIVIGEHSSISNRESIKTLTATYGLQSKVRGGV